MILRSHLYPELVTSDSGFGIPKRVSAISRHLELGCRLTSHGASGLSNVRARA